VPAVAQTDTPAASAPPTAKSPDEIKTLLVAAYSSNVLSFSSAPYHLVASFQTFGPDGTPAGDGIFERWVSSDRHSKTVTHFGGHTMTDFSDNGRSVYTDDGYIGSIMSYYAKVYLDYPTFSSVGISRRNLQTSTTSIHGDLLDCGAFQDWIEPRGYPSMPMDTFCVSRATGNLALRQSERFSVRYEDYAPFLNQSIARRITASKGTHVRCRMKIEQLEQLDQAVLDPAEMTPPADASHTSPEPNIWATKAGETTPIAKGKVPTPPALKASHAEGLVEVFALISRTGSVIEVEPLFSLSPDLEDIALQMVKTWSYKPILRDGKPIEVITLVRLPLQF
jgi:Gram-negative bacterial TonB protein C-terminal